MEIAFNEDHEGSNLWLLQVRPLKLLSEPETVEEQTVRLNLARNKIVEAKRVKPFLVGDTTVLENAGLESRC